jgi:uncharacterized membrane protein
VAKAERLSSNQQTGDRSEPSQDCPPDAPSSNVARVAKLEADALGARSLGARCATSLIRFAGTTAFAAIHLVWFVVWLTVNTGLAPGIRPFDPYPFNFLTLVVSLEAIFLSIWILIGQNEMERLADRRAHLDLQINMLAEQESTAAIRMLQRISERLGIRSDDTVDTALAEETDVERIATAIDERVPS